MSGDAADDFLDALLVSCSLHLFHVERVDKGRRQRAFGLVVDQEVRIVVVTHGDCGGSRSKLEMPFEQGAPQGRDLPGTIFILAGVELEKDLSCVLTRWIAAGAGVVGNERGTRRTMALGDVTRNIDRLSSLRRGRFNAASVDKLALPLRWSKG